MGLRTDLDSIKKRYIYTLIDDNVVIYVGTACNPKSRLKSHIKRIQTEKSLLYRYLRKTGKKPKMIIISELVGTYQQAEKIEIENIQKHSETCLNFYNNPNKKRYNELNKIY